MDTGLIRMRVGTGRYNPRGNARTSLPYEHA
jgi:hypothetical protein